MRSVVKGFEISHLAVPKIHADKINRMYSRQHSPHLPKKILSGQQKPKFPKHVKMPGKNPGVK